MVNPRVFIGSSSESVKIAEVVKAQLESFCDCIVWSDENFFEPNESTYKNLVKKAHSFDFAVFVGGKDDFVVRKNKARKTKTAPRDNVYIEFGLYAGILTTDRTYFLIDKKCTVASDLFGITLFVYKNEKEAEEKCKIIAEDIIRECKVNRIQFLPSTSLAIGYYENFIEPVAIALFNNEKIIIDKKEYDITGYPCELRICFPRNSVADYKTKAQEHFKRKGYLKAEVDAELITRNLAIDFEAFNNKQKVVLYDCPQTLRAAFKAVELATGRDNIGFDENIELVKEKEVRNFMSTVKNLVKTNAHAKKLVKFERFG